MYNARMQSPVRPVSVLVKALLIVVAVELPLASAPLPLGAASSFGILNIKRERFPISTLPAVDAALDVGNLDAMFAAHVVTRPKAPNEFRVFVLGDSAAWGLRLSSDETLPSQMDHLGLACDSRRMRFYNLSFPRPSATKDLMILDKALAYQPDLLIWFVTWYTVMPKAREDHWLITQNPSQYAALARRYGFLPKNYRPPNLWQDMIAQNSAVFRVARFQLYPAIQMATERDQITGDPLPLPTALSSDVNFEGLKPPALRQKQVSLDQVADFYALAGAVPVLLINEPMLIMADVANSDLRYNDYYPRWVYDQYRHYMQAAANENSWDYLDLWDSMRPEYFEDTALHLTATGQRLFVELLAPELVKRCN